LMDYWPQITQITQIFKSIFELGMCKLNF